MGTSQYQLELFIPDCDGKRRVADQVPFVAARPCPNWDCDDGGVRWVIAGQVLHSPDDSYMYPRDQLGDILTIVHAAIERRTHRVNFAGTIIYLETRPEDVHHARFIYDVRGRTRPWHCPPEHRAVLGNIRRVATSVVAGIEVIASRLDALAGPFNERLGPPPSHGRLFIADILESAARIERLARVQSPGRHTPRHGPRK